MYVKFLSSMLKQRKIPLSGWKEVFRKMVYVKKI